MADFARALKASTDPPTVGGPSKLEIAKNAWSNKSLYLPNKAEFICDWLLTKLLKEKDLEIARNPCLNVEIWALLSNILEPGSKPAENSTQRNIWLAPLLNRTPASPIVLAFLRLLADPQTSPSPRIFDYSRRALQIIWPLASPKLTPDALLDCFGAVINALLVIQQPSQDLLDLMTILVNSYSKSLSFANNKKKLCSSFVDAYFKAWVKHCVTPHSPNVQFHNLIYEVGTDTFLSLEALKQGPVQEHGLFSALGNILHERTEDDHSQQIIPKLFATIVQALRRFRSALFGSSSSVVDSSTNMDEWRRACMKVFATLSDLLDNQIKDFSDSAVVRLGLLRVIENEKLCIATSIQEEPALILRTHSALATAHLESSPDETESDILFEMLCTLARIDQDICGPQICDIIVAILHRKSSTPSLSLLGLFLEYHSKTRMMLEYTSSYLSSIGSLQSQNPHVAHQTAFTSSLMTFEHLDHFARAIQSATTSSQILPLLSNSTNHVRLLWTEFISSSPMVSSKKRRRLTNGGAETPSTGTETADALALRFSLSARVIGTLIPALPLHLLTGLESLREQVDQTMSQLREELLPSIVQETIKIIRKNSEEGEEATMWGLYAILAAALRLGPGSLSTKTADRLLEIAKSQKPTELTVEIYRCLLSHAKSDAVNTIAVFESMIGQIHNPNFADVKMNLIKRTWSGRLASLTDQDGSAIGILHLLTTRWLPVFDGTASSDQLHSLIAALLDTPIDITFQGLSISNVVIGVFRSAEFWELPNLRAAFFITVQERTAPLEDAKELSSEGKARIATLFQKLLFVPVEYLPRNVRSELAVRAVALDRLSFAEDEQLRIMIRVFLTRACQYMELVDKIDDGGYLEHLVHSVVNSTPSEAYLKSTLELIEILIQFAVRGSSNSRLSLYDVLACLMRKPTVAELFHHRLPEHQIKRQSILLFIDVLEKTTSISQKPGRTFIHDTSPISTLYGSLQEVINPLIPDLWNWDPVKWTSEYDVLDAWCQVLKLRHWLGILDATPHTYGAQFVRKLTYLPTVESPSRSRSRLYITALSLVSTEFNVCSPDRRQSHLNLVTATYTLLSPFIHSDDRSAFDTCMTKSCKSVSTVDYSQVLQFVVEAIEQSQEKTQKLALLRLASIVMRDAPSGTSKVTQTYFGAFVHLFMRLSSFHMASLEYHTAVLELICEHASDRPATLQLADVSNIYTLIAKSLMGSPAHDKSTSSQIYHLIINITSASVRHRRDLVTDLLPHLGSILQLLISALRRPRPQLGAKQTRIVMDTLPSWISNDDTDAATALGAAEAKALARLLTALTTKTTPRNHMHAASATTEAPKAESLARPFSKHAAYVLQAYMNALNEPLCVMPLDVRRELQPGLFAMCEVMNEHSRDAMMVSALDAGGKASMKALWKEYEKQRYVGKG